MPQIWDTVQFYQYVCINMTALTHYPKCCPFFWIPWGLQIMFSSLVLLKPFTLASMYTIIVRDVLFVMACTFVWTISHDRIQSYQNIIFTEQVILMKQHLPLMSNNYTVPVTLHLQFNDVIVLSILDLLGSTLSV